MHTQARILTRAQLRGLAVEQTVEGVQGGGSDSPIREVTGTLIPSGRVMSGTMTVSTRSRPAGATAGA